VAGWPEGSWYRAEGNALLLRLKVIPRAKTLAFAGASGTSYRIRLTAPPVAGAANAQLCAFVAEAFGVPRGQVRLDRGEAAQHKVVRITDPRRIPLAELQGLRLPLRAP
jgi:uncharacterized protein (TIGR00251 family)